jgi:hydrogenase maturation protease
MSRLLIIGYGNPLRGDDAVGYLAAERLRELLTGPDIEILAVHQLTPELADPISRAERVIFIDAAVTGEPGVILERPITPAPDPSGFTHHSTPSALLAASATLFGSSPEATLYSIPGESFEFGEGLTPRVAESLESLCTVCFSLPSSLQI